MKYAEKIIGLIFASLTVVNLLRGDWLGSAVTGMAAASMLLRGRLKLPAAVEGALGAVALALIVVSIARALA
jgi:hypothetical protein